MPDDKDAHLAAGLVPDLCGIGSRDGDDPEEGKCHVAEWVLHGVRNSTDVLSSPLSYRSAVSLLSQAVHFSSDSHGPTKSMESFCSLQRELHQIAKATALRTWILVSIMHIVINNKPGLFSSFYIHCICYGWCGENPHKNDLILQLPITYKNLGINIYLFIYFILLSASLDFLPVRWLQEGRAAFRIPHMQNNDATVSLAH